MPSTEFTYNGTPHLIYFPPELLIHILSYLDIHSLISVQLVCKAFDELFKDHLNESVIWRNACLVHGLVGFAATVEASSPPSIVPESSTAISRIGQKGTNIGPEPPRREWGRWREWIAEVEKQGKLGDQSTDVVWSDVLDLYSSQSFQGLNMDVNWKAFFKRRMDIHRSFVGQLPSDIVVYRESSSSGPYSDPDSDKADENDDDNGSYLAKFRNIYKSLQRIQDERKKKKEEEEKKKEHQYRPHDFASGLRKSFIEAYLASRAHHDSNSGLDSNIHSHDEEGEESDEDEEEIDEAEFYLDPMDVGGNDQHSEEAATAPGTVQGSGSGTHGGDDDTKPGPRQALTDGRILNYLNILGRIVPAKDQVHRIKVDERNGFFLVTNQSGGLVVRDLESGRVVWELAKNYVRSYAHLEYENGYMIFDRTNGQKEVWRSSSIPPPSSTARVLQPDDHQCFASAFSSPIQVRSSEPSVSTTPFSTSGDANRDTVIRNQLRALALSTSTLSIRQRLLELASTPSSEDLSLEALARSVLMLSRENGSGILVDAPDIDFRALEVGSVGQEQSGSASGGWDAPRRPRHTLDTGSEPGPSGVRSAVEEDELAATKEIEEQEEQEKEMKRKASPRRLSPHFVPHMVIPVPQIQRSPPAQPGIVVTVPDPTRAYRFVYPYLLASSGNRAYVWDVRTGEQIQVVEGIQRIIVPEGYEEEGEIEGTGSQSGGASSVLGSNSKAKAEGAGSVKMTSEGKEGSDDEKEVETEGDDQGEKVDEDEDPTFPTFKPFKSGWWDANSTFSGNKFGVLTSPSSLRSGPLSTPQGNKIMKRKRDPLALISNTSSELGGITYVELGERWIFLCGEEGLRVFFRGKEFLEDEYAGPYTSSTSASKTVATGSSAPQRSSSEEFQGSNSATTTPAPKPRWTPEDFTTLSPGQLVLRIPSDKVQYSMWSASLGGQSYRPHWGSELIRQEVVWDEQMARKSDESVNIGVADCPGWCRAGNRRRSGLRSDENSEDGETEDAREVNALGQVIKRRRKMYDEFIAVHISPCQQHLTLLLSSSRLLFVPRFERLIKAEEELWDAGVDIQLGSVRCPSIYLSYGVGESQSGGSAGRIGVVTQQGIYIITPYLSQGLNKSASSSFRPVELIIMRLAPAFMNPRRLAPISCLQMSDTGVWVNCESSNPPKIELPKEEIKAKEAEDKGRGTRAKQTNSKSGSRSKRSREKGHGRSGGVAPRYGEGEEEDEIFGGDDHDGDEEMGDEHNEEHQWEDVESGGEENEDDETLEPKASHHSEPGERAPLLVHENRPGWVVDPRYPMVAVQFNDEGQQAASLAPAPSLSATTKPTSATSEVILDKGKEAGELDDLPSKSKPEKAQISYHTAGKMRGWINQHFPLDTTPPSQFQVRGGKCKWNHLEIESGKRKLEMYVERQATFNDAAFTGTLNEKRISEHGMGGQGVQNLPNGDLLVETEGFAGEDFSWIQQRTRKSEVHQIRFLPVEY